MENQRKRARGVRSREGNCPQRRGADPGHNWIHDAGIYHIPVRNLYNEAEGRELHKKRAEKTEVKNDRKINQN